jgi:hypothetical protein
MRRWGGIAATAVRSAGRRAVAAIAAVAASTAVAVGAGGVASAVLG